LSFLKEKIFSSFNNSTRVTFFEPGVLISKGSPDYKMDKPAIAEYYSALNSFAGNDYSLHYYSEIKSIACM